MDGLYDQLIQHAGFATQELMYAIYNVRDFQDKVIDGRRAYELAGFKTWRAAGTQIAEKGFKRTFRELDLMVKNAKFFDEAYAVQLGPTRLKAASDLKKSGRWNERWRDLIASSTVEQVTHNVREELRKINEDTKWIRMAVPKSLAEAWDNQAERIKTVLELPTKTDVLDFYVGLTGDLEDAELVSLHESGGVHEAE
jgi:hypothetical protein